MQCALSLGGIEVIGSWRDVTDLLAGVDAKLRRGFDHLEELQREQRAFFATNPFVVVDTTNSQTGWHHVTVRVDREPPIEFGVIVGDAVGQFRSALDLLLTQASRLKKSEGGSLNFPICVERSAFSAAQRAGRSVESVLRAGLPLSTWQSSSVISPLSRTDRTRTRCRSLPSAT